MSDIQKAIDKLTALRDGAVPGEWSVAEERGHSHEYRIVNPARVDVFEPGDYADSSATTDKVTADLIVTLHRTIDAQVAIMKSGLVSETFHSAAQMLAHAILDDA